MMRYLMKDLLMQYWMIESLQTIIIIIIIIIIIDTVQESIRL